MTPINLWYCEKKKQYYILDDDKNKCKYCAKKIERAGILYKGWSRNKKEEYFICLNCTQIHKTKQTTLLYSTLSIVTVKKTVPLHCIFILYKNPSVRDSDKHISVFEEEHIKAHTTIDKTTKAGRISLEGARIGKQTGNDSYLLNTEEEITKHLKKIKQLAFIH